jgi:hypothetical protein
LLALGNPDSVKLQIGLDADDWRFHDLRRTAATNMAIIGVQPHIIEAVLNHKSGIVSGVAAVYNRYAYVDEKREALERWANRVEEMTGACSAQPALPNSPTSSASSRMIPDYQPSAMS